MKNISIYDLIKDYGLANIVVDTDMACQILGISHVTLQKYRNEGKIVGTQGSNRFWSYWLTDIYVYLKHRYNEKYKNDFRTVDKTLEHLKSLPQGLMKIESNRNKGESGSNVRRPDNQTYDTYQFFWIEEGWMVFSNLPMKSIYDEDRLRLCHPSGYPFFIDNLLHDYINYPIQLPMILENIWEEFANKRIREVDLSRKIENLGLLINDCEELTSKYIK